MGHPEEGSGSEDGIATIPTIVLVITGQSWLSSNRAIQFLRAAIQRPIFISVRSNALIRVLLLLLQQVAEDSFAQQDLSAVLTARFDQCPVGPLTEFPFE